MLQTPSPAQNDSSRNRRFSAVNLVRAIPIRWRILSIAALNSAVVVALGLMIWNGAKTLSSAWDDLRQVRNSERVLTILESEAGRLQNLIHRYINQPSPEIFAEILLLREALLGTLTNRAAADSTLSGSVAGLEEATDRFLDRFGELRSLQSAITRTYEVEVLAPVRNMSGLYAIIDSTIQQRGTLIEPSLAKSREAFTALLVASNSYYLSLSPSAAAEAGRSIATIEQTIPVMLDLADTELQRTALMRLREQAEALRGGLSKLAEHFANRTMILRTGIDANQAAMIKSIDDLSAKMRVRERQAQEKFDQTLSAINRQVAIVATIFLIVVVLAGIVIALSIRRPLEEILGSMRAITSGDLGHRVRGTSARDEVGAMARAVEVFRENAIAKGTAEAELRTAKENAENALAELRATQQNLIDAERLAALGGLVAGVAHEVNNPIGISLTVASSFARRSEIFEKELRSDEPLRRSRLEEFVQSCKDASNQLVANLQRAGELIQSFKQVAVDRSHAERRQFDLKEATNQIVASLRPALRKSTIAVILDIADDLVLDSYPGAYGQVLTNLFLNAVAHAFPDGQSGTITLTARERNAREIDITFADDGVGMNAEVQRQAFDPFFTTKRNQGGTGLGLHIVYNLVTQQLDGRLHLETTEGRGTSIRITLPKTAWPRVGSPTAANAGTSNVR